MRIVTLILSLLALTQVQNIEYCELTVGVYRNISFTDYSYKSIDTTNTTCLNDLTDIIVILGTNPKKNFEIRVHEPSGLSNNLGRKHSETKAQTICDYLDKKGPGYVKLNARGMEFREPIVDSAKTSFDFWVNRRVELVLIKSTPNLKK